MHVTSYDWTYFNELRSYRNAMGESVSREYDQSGNLIAETDARGFTERYEYSAENRLIARTDRLGATSRYSYDAYGQRLSETDANQRVTHYTIGAFGQILASSTYFAQGYAGSTIYAPGYAFLAGAGAMSETSRYDWLGRLVESADSFGKHWSYGYDDADNQIRIADHTNAKAVDYRYDALGRRVEETLTKHGLVQRSQTNHYNNQGWLTGVERRCGVRCRRRRRAQPAAERELRVRRGRQPRADHRRRGAGPDRGPLPLRR